MKINANDINLFNRKLTFELLSSHQFFLHILFFYHIISHQSRKFDERKF